MRRVSDGFTIIEVMIFFTVSAMLFASAWALISGRQERVVFDQKTRDTQSKIQQWMSDVSTGTTNGDSSQQSCDISTGRPRIVNVPPPSGYSPNCTFLGKAIQFTDDINGTNPQSGNLYAYSVFGCRLANCSPTVSLANDILPQDMSSAIPEPAVGQMIGFITYADLTETFGLSPAYVKSVTSVAQCPVSPCPVSQNQMIGFMNNFNTDHNTIANGSANGSEDLTAYLYNLNGSPAPANNGGTQVIQCLEGTLLSCPLTPDPPKLQSYQFCLSDGKYSAQITISSASGVGATSRLDYIPC